MSGLYIQERHYSATELADHFCKLLSGMGFDVTISISRGELKSYTITMTPYSNADKLRDQP